MTKPEPWEISVVCELGSPKKEKIVTTPGERCAKIRSGLNPLPTSGATLDVAFAGRAAGVVAVFALTTTVLVDSPNQPEPFPIASAKPPPRTAATRVIAAS